MSDTPTPRLRFEFFSAAFCRRCIDTRGVLSEAVALVPGARLDEYDIVRDAARAEASGITTTPTVIIRDAEGVEVFRASGVPTLDQALSAAGRAL